MLPILEDLVSNGRIADVAIAVMAVEAAVLTLLFWRRSGRFPQALLANFAAGLFLLLALRAGLSGGSPILIAGFLTGALMAHAADVVYRWRG